MALFCQKIATSLSVGLRPQTLLSAAGVSIAPKIPAFGGCELHLHTPNSLRRLDAQTPKTVQSLSLYSLYYAEACNEFAGPISASLRPGNTAPFEEMSQRWRAVGNTVSDLTGPRFEPRTSRSRDERVTARPKQSTISYFWLRI